MEGVGFEEFLAVAAEAGFDAVTLNSALYEEARGAGMSDHDIRQQLQGHGLAVSDIDPLFNWLPQAVKLAGDDSISRCTHASAQDVFQLAHVAGTDLVNAPVGLATPDSEQQVVDCFGTLCEGAAAESLRVSLEFMPFTAVSDLATAARIVEKAGCDNGGIMFDCWHHHRAGGSANDVLDIPAQHFFALQLDDARAEPMQDLVEETLNHRLLPGEGCIDLERILGNLRSSGAQIVYDVEVFKASLRDRTPRERAHILYDSARAITTKIQEA
jgi:sugar phosphate isomerase/epimerase